jgi:hypothetical protein
MLHNAGSVPWEHRLFVRSGSHDTGLLTPPFVAVPATGPGRTAEIAVPMAAPSAPGTYRACFRLAWPDGTYCFPNTLVGAIMTVVVPAPEFARCLTAWPAR